MIERKLTVDGITWNASIAGRVTQYDQDEYTVVFDRRDEHGKRHRRVSRFSPQGSRNRALALGELTELDLTTLFRQSGPDFTSPELNYAR